MPQTSLPGACKKRKNTAFQSDKIYAAWIVGGIPLYTMIPCSLEVLHEGLHVSAVDIVDNQLNISIFWQAVLNACSGVEWIGIDIMDAICIWCDLIIY